MQAAEEREDLVADQPACRVRVRGIEPVRKFFRAAIVLGLAAPDRQERAHDPILALRLDPSGRSARDEPVEDRLDLVGGGMPGGAQPVGGDRVPKLAKVVLRRPPFRGCLDDLGPEGLGAEARVLLRLGAAEFVVYVQGADAVTELPKQVPEAGRVWSTGDESGYLAARLDELVAADVLLDAVANGCCVHAGTLCAAAGRRRRDRERAASPSRR